MISLTDVNEIWKKKDIGIFSKQSRTEPDFYVKLIPNGTNEQTVGIIIDGKDCERAEKENVSIINLIGISTRIHLIH